MRITLEQLEQLNPEAAARIRREQKLTNLHAEERIQDTYHALGGSMSLPGGFAGGLERERKYKSKTEARFADWLKVHGGDWLAWSEHEAIKFRLAKATFWLPDFVLWWRFNSIQVGETWPALAPHGFTIPATNFVQLVDVKMSHHNTRRTEWKDDTRVKIKSTARMFPLFQVVAAVWTGSGWEWEEFQPWP